MQLFIVEAYFSSFLGSKFDIIHNYLYDVFWMI